MKRTTEIVMGFSRPLHGLRYSWALISPALKCWAIVSRRLRRLKNIFMREPASKDQMFDYHPSREAGWLTFVKRALLVVAGVHLLIGLISTYRAYFQIHSLEIVAADTLQLGTAFDTKVMTYGRAYADVTLELVQEGRALTLGDLRMPGNELGFYDPRTRKASFTVTLTPQMLSRFHDGPAILRATAVGTPQWMRLPPPFVRELKVTLLVNQQTHHVATARGNKN